MREATGELNVTLIIVTLVAALVSFFYFVLWPNINNNQKNSSNCSKAICDKKTLNKEGMVYCSYKSSNGTTEHTWCKYKG